MICLACGAEVDHCWRWCPECGSQLVVERRFIDLRSPRDDYAVDWTIESQTQSA